MIRILSSSVLAIGLVACASGPSAGTGAQILGKWTCSTAADGMAVAGVFDYLADGTVKGDAKMDSEVEGTKVSLTGDVVATWQIQGDGKLKETITSLKVKSAVMGGQPAPPALIPTLIQPMIDDSIVGQSSISIVSFAGNTFTSTDEDGVVTSCAR
jgi:hypothetical protein